MLVNKGINKEATLPSPLLLLNAEIMSVTCLTEYKAYYVFWQFRSEAALSVKKLFLRQAHNVLPLKSTDRCESYNMGTHKLRHLLLFHQSEF